MKAISVMILLSAGGFPYRTTEPNQTGQLTIQPRSSIDYEYILLGLAVLVAVFLFVLWLRKK